MRYPNILSDARLPSWAGSGLCLEQQLPLSLTSGGAGDNLGHGTIMPPRRGCGGAIQRIWEGRSFLLNMASEVFFKNKSAKDLLQLYLIPLPPGNSRESKYLQLCHVSCACVLLSK